jgi:chlorobactene glucosyltransferase
LVSLFIAIPLFVLIALAAVCAVYYAVVYARIIHSDRAVPTVRAGLDTGEPAGGWPAVCIVVPAHNEEAVIESCIRGLLAQDYPRLSIVFALDRCTDRTEEVVRSAIAGGDGSPDPRVDVVIVSQCPEGWAGKTHAAWSGVTRGRGAGDASLLLFADADTAFDPALVRAAVGLQAARDLDLLSLLSELTSDRWWERVVQPAAGFELIRQYPLDIVNREERPRAFANGQFMLFRRDLYDRIGGHELVRSELLEDIAFARHLDRVKKTIKSRWGVFMPGRPGMLRCRMYRSYGAFRRGWKRIYTEAALRRPAQLSEWAWRNLLVGVAAPLAGFGCVIVGPIVLWGVRDAAMGLGLMMAGASSVCPLMLALDRVYRDQGLPARYALLYPFGAWRVAGLLAEAARDLREGVKTVWGGREYAREAQR